MKKRIKQVIGVIIGIIIGISTTVGATTIFNSKDITYSSDKTSKTNVKDSLDELYNKTGKCPEGQYCYTEPLGLSDKVELGDYIRMTPTSTSYTVSKDLTGYTSDQTINPSELNIWRVISKNEDGTIDVVSEYINGFMIFKGKTGYMNFVGTLQQIAAQYTNEKYVKKTRHIGYTNQIDFCKEYSVISCPGLYPIPRSDIDTLINILGEYKGRYTSGTFARYWLASRCNSPDLKWIGGWDVSNEHPIGSSFKLTDSFNSSFVESTNGANIRPVLTLKSDVKIKNGDGKSESTAYVLD